MGPLELQTLEACQEAMLRQQEMLSLLAASLDVPAEDVFYCWMLRRGQFPQHGRLSDPAWTYFFHGYECDLHNIEDGRHLRLDFGPKGTVETLSAWGILQFIMASTPPWPVFENLKRSFAKSGPPYDELSGDVTKLFPVWDRLEAASCLEAADPELLLLVKNSTTVGPDGIHLLRLPDGTPPDTRVNCLVAHRQGISSLGRRNLERLRAEPARETWRS